MALKAKALNKERRASGEAALAKNLRSGGSLVDMGLDALGVGLPAMIADKIGQGLASVTGKVNEVRKGLREGTEDWASVTVKTLEAIPIAGPFATAGKNIREMITGEQQAIDETNRAAEAANSVAEAWGEVSKKIKEIKRGWADLHRDMAADEKKIGATDFQKAMIDTQLAGEKQIEAIRDKQQKEKEALQADPAYLKAKAALAEARKGSDPALIEGAELQLKRVNDDIAKARADIDKAADAAAVDAARITEEKKAEIRREHRQTEIREERELQAQLMDLRLAAVSRSASQEAAVYAQYYRNVGQGRAADATALDAAAEEKKRQTERYYQQLHDKLQGDIEKAEKEKQPERAAKLRAEQAKLPQEQQAENERNVAEHEQQAYALKKSYDRKATDLLRAAQDAQAAAQAEADESKLREQGRYGEAQIALLKRQEADRLEEIDRQAKRAAQDDRENAPKILAAAEAEKARLRTKTAEDVRKAQTDEANKQFDVQSRLTAARIDSLREEAKWGDVSAYKEAHKLEVQDKYNRKRHELKAILTDEHADAPARARAQAQINALDRRERRELAMPQIESVFSNPEGVDAGRGITGLQMKSKEENNPALQYTKLIAKHAEAQVKAIQKLGADIVSKITFMGVGLTGAGG